MYVYMETHLTSLKALLAVVADERVLLSLALLIALSALPRRVCRPDKVISGVDAIASLR